MHTFRLTEDDRHFAKAFQFSLFVAYVTRGGNDLSTLSTQGNRLCPNSLSHIMYTSQTTFINVRIESFLRESNEQTHAHNSRTKHSVETTEKTTGNLHRHLRVVKVQQQDREGRKAAWR